MDQKLFAALESAVRVKKPKVADALQPGLSEAQIRAILGPTRTDKDIDAVVALYSWKNGVDADKARQPFFSETIYQFLPLDEAVEHCASMQEAIDALVAMGSPIEMPQDATRYLPVFWDGVTASLAIDLEPGMNNRVMEIEFESEMPFREVSDSFEWFLSMAIKATQDDEAPAFLDISSSL